LKLEDFDYNSLMDWYKPFFFSGSNSSGNSMYKVIASANKTLLKTLKLIKRIESAEQTSKINAEAIPDHAMYVRCGKVACENDPHGPYYYAYWKEKVKGIEPVQSKCRNKLKKKYIGTCLPSRCLRM
jgi:hypothetical protein